MIEILSTFGNTSILLLLSALLAAWLAREAGVRANLVWICVLALCVGVIAGLMIYFHGCPRPAFGFRSPGGHVGFSQLVYGAITICADRDHARWPPLGLPALGCVWIVGDAWPRYALHEHNFTAITVGY